MPAENGNGGRDSRWGGGHSPASDVADQLRRGLARLKRIAPSGRPGGLFVLGALVLAALIAAWTAYFTVPSDSVAVIQRFGKYLKNVEPGLHFKLPFGMDTATVVPVKRQLKQEFGFTTPGASDPYQSPRPQDGKRETQMVTLRPECRAGGMGGSIPHLGPGQIPFRGSRAN
jgi:membrane protease subunit HflK